MSYFSGYDVKDTIDPGLTICLHCLYLSFFPFDLHFFLI